MTFQFPARSISALGLDEDGAWQRSTLNQPDKENRCTFESYEELGDLFRALARASGILCLRGADRQKTLISAPATCSLRDHRY